MLARTGRLLLRAARRFRADDAPTRAAALTFGTLLALVPFLAVFFAILSAFTPFLRTEARLEAFLLQHLLPATASAAIEHLTRLTERTAALGAVGFVALLVTSLLLLNTIEAAFRHIYRLPEGRSVRQRLLSYWTTLTVAPLLFGVSLYLSGAARRLSPLVVPEGALEVLARWEVLWGYLVPFLVSAAGFTLAYLVLPATRVRLLPAFTGGVVAALLWEVAKAAFDWYVRHFASYEQVYGALALVPVFLLWVHLTWLIVLFGAEVAYCAEHPEPGPEAPTAEGPEPACGPLAARVLWVAVREFVAGRPRPSVDRVAAELSADIEAVEGAVGALEAAGLLARVPEPGEAEGAAGLLPARPLEQVTVADAVRAGEARGGSFAEGAAEEGPIHEVLEAAERESLARLGRETFAALAARWRARPVPREAGESAGDPSAAAPAAGEPSGPRSGGPGRSPGEAERGLAPPGGRRAAAEAGAPPVEGLGQSPSRAEPGLSPGGAETGAPAVDEAEGGREALVAAAPAAGEPSGPRPGGPGRSPGEAERGLAPREAEGGREALMDPRGS